MKTCPVCGARCFDDMEVCYGCLHDFTREDASPAGQAVASACEAEVEEAVMPTAPAGQASSRVPRIAEQPTTQIPRATLSGGSVTRAAARREGSRQTHIVVPLDGCAGPSSLVAGGFRLVISLEPVS